MELMDVSAIICHRLQIRQLIKRGGEITLEAGELLCHILNTGELLRHRIHGRLELVFFVASIQLQTA
jgi:hypothetical protein